MKERPILFSAPMVRAILDGSKTQTRRVVSITPPLSLPNYYSTGRVLSNLENQPGAFMEFRHTSQDEAGFTGSPAAFLLRCPYGKPGDRLWVRETWRYHNWTEDGIPYIKYAADEQVLLKEHPFDWCDVVEGVWADLSEDSNYSIDGAARDRKNRPSIHMPRWASRILLEIVSVRAERLQNISEQDAKAEGFDLPHADGQGWKFKARHNFKFTWDSIYKNWDANPWVWVIEFKPISN